MIIRSKAPLRLGFAGGGTDLSPFCDMHGGYILNATIDKYVYCTIEPMGDGQILFASTDRDESAAFAASLNLGHEDPLALHKGVYNRIIRDFVKKPLSFRMTTFSEATTGSGLGGSSTLVVAMLQAYTEWLKLPLGEYDIAKLAHEIERKDIGFAGGKQDQYAATFGGFNFMEFYHDRVIVNPLRVKDWILAELELSMLLCFTGLSRDGSRIIDDQIRTAANSHLNSLAAYESLKTDSVQMKEAILTGDLARFATILDRTWHVKKSTAASISNPHVERIYEAARAAGAHAGKLSGAGGGGFFMFMMDPARRQDVARALTGCGGTIASFHFTHEGAMAWQI